MDNGQQSFELHPPPQPRTLDTNVEAVIYCAAKVATLTHRAMAAATDLSIIAIASVVVLGIFRFAGGEVVLNRQTIPLYLALPGLLALFYWGFWCATGRDSTGMRATGLRLLNFDGNTPTSRQRVYRIAGGCLSVFAGGLGLLWALADEESLTWHDHVSKTFPTIDE